MINGCAFARKNKSGDGYEYGHVEIENYAEKKEVRKYIVHGVASSMEEALAANNMALTGASRIGIRRDEMPWREFGCN